MAQTTNTYNCPTHGDVSKTVNASVPPPKTPCPVCGQPSKLVS